VLGFYAFFGKNNLKRKDSLIKEQSDNSDNLSLFDLLELAKNKQKPLSKAEIMSELKLDIKTVDNLLKDAEINQLCHVQLDGDNGTIKYKFDV
jgi:hypothetical protein